MPPIQTPYTQADEEEYLRRKKIYRSGVAGLFFALSAASILIGGLLFMPLMSISAGLILLKIVGVFCGAALGIFPALFALGMGPKARLAGNLIGMGRAAIILGALSVIACLGAAAYLVLFFSLPTFEAERVSFWVSAREAVDNMLRAMGEAEAFLRICWQKIS